MFAYGLFGLVFGGTMPHYFYKYAEQLLANAGKAKLFYLLFLQQCIYTPLYQLISLYTLSRFEVSNII